MQRLRELPLPLKVLAGAAAVAGVLAVAVGVGVLAALTLGSDPSTPEGAEPERAGGERTEGGGLTEAAVDEATLEEVTTEGPSEAEYLEEVGDIQEGAVEASLRSNDRLLRYDRLTASDVEAMEADSAVLVSLARRAENLDLPSGYEDQHEVFVLAINELREANELAYGLASDPASATQDDFRAYDRHVDSATSQLNRSNEILGRDYSTPEAAQEVSIG